MFPDKTIRIIKKLDNSTSQTEWLKLQGKFHLKQKINTMEAFISKGCLGGLGEACSVWTQKPELDQ